MASGASEIGSAQRDRYGQAQHREHPAGEPLLSQRFDDADAAGGEVMALWADTQRRYVPRPMLPPRGRKDRGKVGTAPLEVNGSATVAAACLRILTRHHVPEQFFDDLIDLAETENELSRRRLRSPLLRDIDVPATTADHANSVDGR